MELGRISFLFLLGVLFFCFNGFAQDRQEPVDSASFHYNAILNPKDYNNLPAAIDYYTKTAEQRLAAGDTVNAITDLRLIAIGESELDFFSESEVTAVKALELVRNYSKPEKVNHHKIPLTIHIGRVYRWKKDYEGALKLYKEALEVSLDDEERSVLNNNIGNVYEDLEQFETAQQYFQTAYTIARASKDSINLAFAADNLGSLYNKRNRDDGLPFLRESLHLRKLKNNAKGVKTSYQSLGRYYLNRNLGLAKAYADSMMILARKQRPEDVKEALELQIDLGNNEVAREFMLLTDSLETARSLASNKYAYQKYGLTLEQQRAALLTLENEKIGRQRFLLLLLVVFLAVVSTLSYFLIRNRNKRRRIREVFETESRISKKVHDEVANDLYHVMTKMESGKQDAPATLDELERIYEKTRDISRELADLDTHQDYGLLLLELLQGYTSEDVQVITRNLSGIEWASLSSNKKATLYRTLQELMTNMKKHSRASLVALTFQQKSKGIRVNYSDNGVGTVISEKSGLQNTENRMDAIGGSISFESEPGKGFKATITI